MTNLLSELEEAVALLDTINPHADDACWQFIANHHAEIAAALRDTAGEREVFWEVWQDDEPQASSGSLPEALHYLAMYQQDGPVQLVRVVNYRETITPEHIAALTQETKPHG